MCVSFSTDWANIFLVGNLGILHRGGFEDVTRFYYIVFPFGSARHSDSLRTRRFPDTTYNSPHSSAAIALAAAGDFPHGGPGAWRQDFGWTMGSASLFRQDGRKDLRFYE